MKREAFNHTKIKRLCRRMNLATWQAIGLLESLWHVTARETPRGDIGKLSNEDIALAIDYGGNEDVMIESLVHCGWIDRDPVERLVIHDWAEHADSAVHSRVARSLQYFVAGVAPKLYKIPTKERAKVKAFFARRKSTHISPPLHPDCLDVSTEQHTASRKPETASRKPETASARLATYNGVGPTTPPKRLAGIGETASQNTNSASLPEPEPEPVSTTNYCVESLDPSISDKASDAHTKAPVYVNGATGSQASFARAFRSPRFTEWLGPWPRVGSSKAAAKAWDATVETPEDEAGAFAARDRYLASDEVARNIVMGCAKFLREEKEFNPPWNRPWPAATARKQPKASSKVDEVKALALQNLKRTGRIFG